MRRRKVIVSHVALLCLIMLSTSFYVWGSTDTTSIVSLATINYGGRTANLKFKSGFESGITWTWSSYGQLMYLHGADSYGYNWDTKTNHVNFVVDAYPDHGNASIDSSFSLPNAPSGAYNGSRALQLMVIDQGLGFLTAARWELFMHDGDSGSSMTFNNMQYLYWSRWVYIPSDYDIDSWMSTGSVRETGTYSGGDVCTQTLIYKRDGKLVWGADSRAFTQPHHYFWSSINDEVAVPLGRWFKWETYVYRHQTNGFWKVWIDGVQIFNVTGVTTKWSTSAHSFKLKPQHWGYAKYGDANYPFVIWLDELEIWDGIP